ncbi:MAG: hypothetical protein F9K47_02835 [Burkholderiales bacterium]|nr:MAG: hypothetical protein F9K47_02835 [Burkholderiales bacterium]
MARIWSCLMLTALASHAWSAGQLVDLQWSTQGHFRHTATLQPGAVLEVCGPLEAGMVVNWSFTADQPLESNVHYHEGERVTYPAKHPPLQKLDARLVVDGKHEFCWMWRNRQNAAVALELELRR